MSLSNKLAIMDVDLSGKRVLIRVRKTNTVQALGLFACISLIADHMSSLL